MNFKTAGLALAAFAGKLSLTTPCALALTLAGQMNTDAWNLGNEGKHAEAAKIYERMLSEKVCTDNLPSEVGGKYHCYSRAHLSLAETYIKLERYQEAADQYKAVIAAPPDDLMCVEANYGLGKLYAKLAQPANADKYYEAALACKAADKEWSSIRHLYGKQLASEYYWEKIMKDRIATLNFLGHNAKVVELSRQLYFQNIFDEKVASIYKAALEKEGLTAEVAEMVKFQEVILEPMIQWQKVNKPDPSSPNPRQALENYKVNRLAMLKNALKSNTAYKLKSYEDYLISMIRKQQKELDEMADSKEKDKRKAEERRLAEENSRRLEEEANRSEQEKQKRTDELYQNMFKAVIEGGGAKLPPR